jgi:hypothetical protein
MTTFSLWPLYPRQNSPDVITFTDLFYNYYVGYMQNICKQIVKVTTFLYTRYAISENGRVFIIFYSATQKGQQFAVKTWMTSEYPDDYCNFNTKIQTSNILSLPLRSHAWNTSFNTVTFSAPVARNIIRNLNFASTKPNIVLGAVESVYTIIFYSIWLCFVLFDYTIISFPSGYIRRGFKHFIHVSFFSYTIESSESVIMICVSVELSREIRERCQTLGYTATLIGATTAFCCIRTS